MKLDVASRGRLSADLLLSPLEPDDEPEPWGEEVADEDVLVVLPTCLPRERPRLEMAPVGLLWC